MIIAMKKFLGTNDTMVHLVMLAINLQELHRVLGSQALFTPVVTPDGNSLSQTVIDVVFGANNKIVAVKKT